MIDPAASERAEAVRIAREDDPGADRRLPADIERIGRLLDSSIRLPGNVRIGIDGLIGLLPGVGDAAGALFAFYIVSRASALGLPKAVLGRMLLNVGIDALVGAVPLLGDLFDFAFKANTRNVELMRRAILDDRRERRTSMLLLAGVLIALVAFAALMIALGILLARLIASAL